MSKSKLRTALFLPLIFLFHTNLKSADILSFTETNGATVIHEEGETSDTYGIALTQQPTAAVKVVISGPAGELTFGADRTERFTITFTPDNWQTPQDVQITAIDDAGIDLLQTHTLLHTVGSTDTGLHLSEPVAFAIRIMDNDFVHALPDSYSIPTIDLDKPRFQVVVDREEGQYLGHPTTTLLEDSSTILTVYPKGHGRGAIVYKKSFDGGKTWSDRLPTPESWATSKEVPTLFRMTDPEGVERIIMFSGLYPARRAYSEDNGKTWSELEVVGNWGGIVVMGCFIRLKDGRYMAMFHDDGRFFKENGARDGFFRVFKTYTSDGGLTWSYPETVIECEWAAPCEPGIFRSPDGKQLLVLMRENSRKYNSLMMTSNDEGDTWSDLIELPAALTGDRHTGKYLPDGRLFISFRDLTLSSPTRGDWVGWVGTYDDIINGREGKYRVRLKDNHKGADCAYPGVERMPDGTIVTTTYGHWDENKEPYIMTIRFKIASVDSMARSLQPSR